MPEDVLEQTPAPSAETPPEDTTSVEEPIVEQPVEPPQEETHPLEPGGERFKEVWARAKRTEDRLQREREERIRLEERLRAAEEAKKQAPQQEREYTWAELEEAIATNKITRADALVYREKLIEKRAAEKARQEAEHFITQQTQIQRVVSDIDSYRKVIPDVDNTDSDDFKAVAVEYQDLVATYGKPKDQATELKYQRDALKRAFGPVDRLRKPVATPKPKVDSVQDTTTDARPTNTSKSKDVLTTLTPSQKAHYEKMITRGVYEGWDDVREELNWTRKPKKKQ